MTGRNRRKFSPGFRPEAAPLVLDKHYTVAAAVTAMNVSKSTIDKWVRLLKEVRAILAAAKEAECHTSGINQPCS